MWLGKIIGGTLGIMLGSPVGVMFGLFVGHMFDRAYRLHSIPGFHSAQSENQAVFFRETFMVMGHIAKSDGHVSKKEIQFAENIMDRMQLNAQQRQEAIRFFNQGKSADFDLMTHLNEVRSHLSRHRMLLQFFIELQFQLAMAEGALSDTKKQILKTICMQLGVGPLFQRFSHVFGQGFHGQHQQSYQQTSRAPRYSLEDDYTILNVSPECSDKELKQAYRKAMSQNHPDKLMAQGLPEAMIKMATEKTQALQGAYERLRTARGA